MLQRMPEGPRERGRYIHSCAVGWDLEWGRPRKASFKKKGAFYLSLEGWLGFQVAERGERIVWEEEALGTEERLAEQRSGDLSMVVQRRREARC